MRKPNEIDFWRGFALVTIFINHVPGIIYDRFTTRNVSISDSAELFVFLAGWSLRYLVRAQGPALPGASLAFRLFGRAFQIYAAQLVITLGAIALIAGASLWLDQPLLLEWHNAEAVFAAPVPTHVGLALLLHQLGYFNILPLYVVLMIFAPFMALLDRRSPWALFWVSAWIWAFALVSGVNFQTWPVEGRWFFNPLSWQFVFTMGFLAAREDRGPGAVVRRHLKFFKILAFPIVVAGAVAAFNLYSPNPARLPEPRLIFMFDKTFASPARLVHFLSVAMAFAGLWSHAPAIAPKLSEFFAMLGRNSLNVFCAASLLSLTAQIVRFALGGGIVMDTLMLGLGLTGMGFVAWVSEWRERTQTALSAQD